MSGQVIQSQVLEYAQIAMGDSGWAAASNAQREDVLRNLYQGFRSQFLIDALTRMLSCNHDEANNQVQKWLTEKKALHACAAELHAEAEKRRGRARGAELQHEEQRRAQIEAEAAIKQSRLVAENQRLQAEILRKQNNEAAANYQRQTREQKEQAARAREAEVAKKRNAEEEKKQIREQKEQAARAREAEVAKKRNGEEERNAKKRDFADIDAAFFPGQPVWYKRNQRAKVLSVHVDLSEKSDFYTIQIMPDGGERQTIGEHLESETAWQKRTDDQTPIQFSNGSKVRLKGLVNQAALNGLLAEIVEWIGDKKKYKVLLARSKQRMLVSPVNLTHADAQPPPPSASTKQYATEHVLVERMDDGFCDGGRAAGAKSGDAWRFSRGRGRNLRRADGLQRDDIDT